MNPKTGQRLKADLDTLHEDIKSLVQGQRVEFDIKHSSKGIAATSSPYNFFG